MRLGTSKDVLSDGGTWDVRYLTVDTGNWLPGKRVLLTPADIENADWGKNSVTVHQTKEQVKNAPHIDEDKPVSRQMEADLAAYYGWPAYWEGDLVMGAPAPVMVERPERGCEPLTRGGEEQPRVPSAGGGESRIRGATV